MIIRHLIMPLAVALFAMQAMDAHAQGAFPAPLPGAAAGTANDPAFPPVNGGSSSPFPPVGRAPAASVGAPSPFPSAGAPPVGGFSQPAQQAGPPGGEDCMKYFLPLRQEAEKRGNLIKAASARHAPPQEACKLIGNFAQSEVKMIKYVESNSQKCGIPANVGDQMKAGHKNTEKMLQQVCNAAQQQAQQRGPAAPSLADVLGSSSAPEANTKRSGGSTFDTLSGNVLTR